MNLGIFEKNIIVVFIGDFSFKIIETHLSSLTVFIYFIVTNFAFEPMAVVFYYCLIYLLFQLQYYRKYAKIILKKNRLSCM